MASETGIDVTLRAETALLDLVAERPFRAVGLSAVAERAGVALADLRRAYDGPLDILSGFARRIDTATLAGDDPGMKGEPTKDRLFDVLMRRFDLLAPHRAGLKGLERSARRDPVLALHLGRLVVGSQAWMLEAAGVSSAGPRGALRALGLAAGLARVVPVFLAEDESGLPKTMAALDATLDRLGGLARRVRGIEARLGRFTCRRACDAPAAKTNAEPSAAAADPSI